MLREYLNRRGFLHKAGFAALSLSLLKALPFINLFKSDKKIKIEVNPSAIKRNKTG